MMFFFVVGNRYRTRHEGMTPYVMTCPSCGMQGQFEQKSGRQYLTLFFVIPVLPLGGAQELLECPRCHAQFQAPDRQFRVA